jgi:hypothetical protein
MTKRPRFRAPLARAAKRGFRGYPVATIALYGPDDQKATKVAVGIVEHEGGNADLLRRWFSTEGDIRSDPSVTTAILAFIREAGARTVVTADRILGCPHEEGLDYPDGATCPQCPFWATRDRWTGEEIS